MAGETIKGLNVVIGSDTTGLTSALSDVNKASRGIQSELKQVEKLLKLDPTNTELLAQKQQLLTDAVANTTEKLNRLRVAQDQVSEQFARGEISEGAYRAFQREIAATEQQLRSFETQIAGTVADLNQLGDTAQVNADKLKGVGDKLKGAGENMSMAITAPIVAAGGLMLKGAIDAETAQGKLQASLGITAEEAEKLGVVAQEVWKNGFGESIEEANEALTTIKKNMAGLSDDELKPITEGAMTLADVFGAEVADSTKAAGTMMKNFGISGQDALDLITVGFQKGGDYSGELLDTLNEYSPQFASMGLSADQAMGILLKGAENGAFSLDKVGDAMKEFNIRAQDGSKATAEGFSAIGLNAQKMGAAMAKGGEDGQKAFTATVTALAAMKNPIEQNAAGTALFGTQWEDVRAKVIVAMVDGVKGIGDFKGATDEATTAMYANNPGLAMTKAFREMQLAVGPALLGIADIIQNTIAPAIKNLAEGFSNFSPVGKKVVLAIVGIIAILGPLLMIVGSATGIFASLSVAAGAAGVSIGALVAPIAITVAIIAAVIAAGIALYKNWDTIKAKLAEAWGAIKENVSTVWGSIVQFFQELPEKISTFFSELPWKLGYIIGQAIGELIKFGHQAITWATTEVPRIIDNVVSFFKNLPGKIKEQLSNTLTSLVAWISNMKITVANEIPKITSSIVTFFSELPGKMVDIGVDIVKGLWEGIKSMAGWLGSLIKGFVKGLVQGTKDALGEKSPSKVFAEIGKNVSLGLAMGIEKELDSVADAAKSMANTVMDVNIGLPSINGAASLAGGSAGRSPSMEINIQVGTLVGKSGMDEFANIVSKRIARSYGFGTGGDF